MRTLKTWGAAVAVALVLVTGVDHAASAATGKPFLLGRINKANKVTTAQRTTTGPALNLVTRSSASAPMTVNGVGKVANLNADKVDGVDAAALRTRSYVWRSTFTDRSTVVFVLPLPAGSYLVSYTSVFHGLGISSLECAVAESDPVAPDRYTARSATYNGDTTMVPALTGSGLVTKKAGNSIRVICATNGHPFSASASSPLEIVATPTTVVSSGSLVSLDN